MPTNSDQEPRGSLGSQNPYAVNTMWDAMTIGASDSVDSNAPPPAPRKRGR